MSEPRLKKTKKSRSRKRSLTLDRSEGVSETTIKTLIENSHTLYADRSFRTFDNVSLKGTPNTTQLWRLEAAYKVRFKEAKFV